MANHTSILKNGILNENPAFKLALGMCPALAVTTSAFNGLGMGLSTTVVLICSNIVVSLLRNFIPHKVRIPAFIIIIASFVTIVQMLLKAYLPELDKSLGIFIPLIVVNCVILARAESFASKNKLLPSVFDGIGMGLGFTLALFVTGTVREILGNGTFGSGLYEINLLNGIIDPAVAMILPPGGFLAFGLIIGIINVFSKNKVTTTGCHNCKGDCKKYEEFMEVK